MYNLGILGLLERLGRFLLYRKLNFKYGNKINSFFMLGESAIKQYRLYGFTGEKVFQYMYCPNIKVSNTEKNIQSDVVKFLYIGRFDDKIKGIGLLIKAFEQIKEKNWSLDLVGGYGDYKEEVMKWCERTSNVNFIGTWEYNQVCDNMKNYDVCIVPSRFDGWNLTPNQAIHAGIATLVSNQSGSDELIKYSSSGLIFKANNAKDLSNKISYIISNYDRINIWKENAKSYRECISKEVVGKYFYDCLMYTFFEKIRNLNVLGLKIGEKINEIIIFRVDV